ncbi:DUF302 domain-containing protein [Modicisalibacter luteus]|uniref:DUF302 domain-containing protein n=1 Tax=Modicisalibacter luteus TaxID=453962 RepID=A0ABV7LZP9_9GAMM|nr:DUF302 domain-containing protein [Halomonas lutea]GHA96546.1 hypothetical protein GCM10007159_17860 [Halomonas lutea]
MTLRIPAGHRASLSALLLTLTLGVAQAATTEGPFPGIEHVTSQESVNEVEAKLRKALESRGLTLFTVIDHAQGAVDAGQELPPTLTVIFGNPKVDTPMLQCQGSAALDLPQKMVIRKVDDGTRIEWNSPAYLAERHGLQDCDLPLDDMAGVVGEMAHEAAGK